ncbi:MAG: ABC transporter ATP-binding protein [Planctomycetes bacterium]|nr:ABC transporter ATP-binding protein [Planctomycetota bacterium]
MNGLRVSNLRKSYGTHLAVDGLSFQVDQGEIFGLIGPNGAGKSTTMLIIIGLLRADAGKVEFDGRPFDPNNADMRSWLGIAPQELAIYPELTAAQNLRFFGKLNGLSGAKLKDRVDYVLALTGLTPNADHTPSTFSGGMSRRLNFGIALLNEPRFVILDEPTVGIDPQSRSNLLDGVRDLSRQGVGVLYASHYMEEVEAICHRVAIIDRGRLLRQGTLDELQDRTRIDLCVRVPALPLELAGRLAEIAEVRREPDGGQSILVHESLETQRAGQSGRLRAVLETLEQARIPLRGISTQEASLETLFLRLTGRTLRD